MRRSRSAIVCALGALAIAGCADHGSYTLPWVFMGGEVANIGCGLHGVDSIHVTGSNTAGDGETATALCTDGQLAHSIPVGTWTFTVHQVDVRGVEVDPVEPPMVTIDVPKDGNATVDPAVELTPRVECADGIDNDGDGRVDLDDPECAGDPSTALE